MFYTRVYKMVIKIVYILIRWSMTFSKIYELEINTGKSTGLVLFVEYVVENSGMKLIVSPVLR